MYQVLPFILKAVNGKEVTLRDLGSDLFAAQNKIVELYPDATTVTVRDPQRVNREATINHDNNFWLIDESTVID